MASLPGKKPVPLFFAFPDGVFHHVCAECNALCCRAGWGFAGSLKREMPYLLKHYPALSTMVKGREGNLLHFSTAIAGCFFLNAGNLCQIEVDHGKSRKPGVCAVFPFNSFKRIGATVAVMPHFFCPLRIELPARPGKFEGTHATIEQNIRNSALIDADHVESQMRDTKLHPAETTASVLTRETRFRDTCARALGRARFQDTVMSESANPKLLEATVSRAIKLMGWDSGGRRHSHSLDNLLLAMAPVQRTETLHLSSEQMLAALLLGERAALQALSLSNAPPTPQAVYEVIQNVGCSIRVLARGDDVPRIPSGINSVQFGASELSFVYHVALERIARDGTLTGLEKTFKRRVSAADRAVIVRQFGIQMESSV
jgi:Fe-S-cluster containining protein